MGHLHFHIDNCLGLIFFKVILNCALIRRNTCLMDTICKVFKLKDDKRFFIMGVFFTQDKIIENRFEQYYQC